MRTKTGQLGRMAATALSLVVLLGLSFSVPAGQGKYAWKAHEKAKNSSPDAAAVDAPPAPVTDDTPINPDARCRGKAADSSGSRASSKAPQHTSPNRTR